MDPIFKEISDLILREVDDFDRFILDARKDEEGRVTIPIEINGNERAFGGITDSNGCFFYMRWRDDYIFYEDAGEDRRTGSCENFLEQRSPIRIVAVLDRSCDPYNIEAKIRTALLKYRIQRGAGIKSGRIVVRQSLIDSFLVLKEESPKPKKFDKNLTFVAVDFDLSIDMSVVCDTRPTAISGGPSANYRNSDGSFSQSIDCGSTFVAPDIQVTDCDGSTFNQPANLDVLCTPGSGATIFNRPAPSFGQTTANFSFDEGYNYQAGTYTTGYLQGSGQVQQLDETDLLRETLLYNNQYGNKNRFTDGNGAQDWLNATNSSADLRNVTEDHLTGLAWVNRNAFYIGFSNSTWLNNLSNVAAANVLNHADWRVPSMSELSTITNQANVPFDNGTYFRIGVSVSSCSVRRDVSNQRYIYTSQQGIIYSGTGGTSTVVALFVRTM